MDGIEELLKAWGEALVCREEGIPRTSGGRTHALDRARDFAPVTRERFLASVVGRDGHSRRAYMAEKMQAGDRWPQLRVIPMWAADPVPCTASRPSPGRSTSPGLPDHLRPLNDAVRALARFDDLAAKALREQYSGRGTQADMAARLGVSKRQFERALARGRGVVRRTLHAPLTPLAEVR
jgi:hypothetical protein